MKASGDGFSDGEQHYLPILPDEEMVMNTVPFTQHEAGVKTIDVAKLFPETSSKRKLTVEYTNNPAWFMIQALPFVGDVDADNATGFVFTEPASYELLNCLRRVLIFYLQDKAEFRRVRKNAMKIRYSWDKSASEYETMYRSALDSPQKI